MPTQVEIVALSGEALDWFRTAMTFGLALGLVIVLLLAALLVRALWR